MLFEGRKRVAPFQGSEPAGPGGWFDKLPHREGEGREGEARTGIVKIGLGPLPFVSGNTRNPLGCKPCKATALAGEEDLGGIVIRGKPIHGGFEKIGILEKDDFALILDQAVERGRCKVVVVVVVEAFAKEFAEAIVFIEVGVAAGLRALPQLAHASRCRRRTVIGEGLDKVGSGIGLCAFDERAARLDNAAQPIRGGLLPPRIGLGVEVGCAPYAALRINGVVEIACHRSFSPVTERRVPSRL